MSARSLRLFASLTGATLMVAALSACDGSDSAMEDGANGKHRGPAFVRVVEVTLKPEMVRLEAVGNGRALQSVTLYPEMSGEVTEVAFTAGQTVKKGDVLLRLEARDETLAVDLAKVRLADAEQLLHRYQRAQAGAVPETQIDTARNALASAKLTLSQAEVALADRQVRAPFDGTIGLTDVDVGDRIGPETAIAPFDDLTALLVDFPIPEQFLGRIAEGDTVALRPWTASIEDVTGTIVALDTRVDRETRTFRGRARVDNPDATLRPGLSFRVTVELAGRAYPVLPEASIVWGADGSFAWAVRDGKAVQVPLVIVQRNPGEVLVDAALKAGDLVVYEGVQRMRQGASVDYELTGPVAREDMPR